MGGGGVGDENGREGVAIGQLIRRNMHCPFTIVVTDLVSSATMVRLPDSGKCAHVNQEEARYSFLLE